MTMKNLMLAAAVAAAMSAPALAVEAGVETDTSVDTGVSTTQDSGVMLGDKAKVRGDIYTGANTADTSVSTDVDTSSEARAGSTNMDNTTNNVENPAALSRSDNRYKGKGNKYGLNRDDENNRQNNRM